MNLRKERRRLANDFETLIDDVNRLLQATSSQAGAELGEVPARLRETLADMKDRVEGIERSAVERARSAAHATDEYVHHHPWTALAAAGVIGLLIGALISQRR